MTPDEFKFVAGFLYERSGLALTPDKGYLLESRLGPVASANGLAGLTALVQRLRAGDARLATEVVEAMTTNETSFFRDTRPFDVFRQHLLPALLESRADRRTIRIWNAACSTGQEPYSVAELLQEQAARLAGWRIEIVATDLAEKVLARARQGIYSQFEVQRGLPVTMLVKNFEQKGVGTWQLKPALRAMVDYRRHNLLTDPPPSGRFDLIFCRNVLIYFDQATKQRALNGLLRVLAPDGRLMLGAAETVLGLGSDLVPVPGLSGVYGLTGAVPAGRPLPPLAAAPLAARA